MTKPKQENKKLIKAFIIVGDENEFLSTTLKKDEEGKVFPTGYPYIIWKLIKERLEDKYEFEEIFSKENENNYDKFVEDTAAGKYDIVIGLFAPSEKRHALVFYTLPIFLNSQAILYEPNNNIFKRFYNVMKGSMHFFVVLFIFGIISGILLYFSESRRAEFFQHIGKSKRLPKLGLKHLNFRRTLLTTIAAFFGEMGFLSENSTLTMPGIIIIILIMICAFLLIMYIQGEITNINIETSGKSGIDKSDLKDMTVIGPKGYASCKKLKRFGLKVKYYEHQSFLQLIDIYEKNKDKYDGVCVSWGDAFGLQWIKPNLRTAWTNLGQQNNSFIVNREQPILLEDVNKAIIKLKDSLEIQDLCYSYFGWEEEYPCGYLA